MQVAKKLCLYEKRLSWVFRSVYLRAKYGVLEVFDTQNWGSNFPGIDPEQNVARCMRRICHDPPTFPGWLVLVSASFNGLGPGLPPACVVNNTVQNCICSLSIIRVCCTGKQSTNHYVGHTKR